ncbi:MAG: LysM peptidoglycan-binding domain-containing protein [Thermacetogeniaceae bacterium]|jgi:cell wall-associated NlpC family hydrolase|nr:LysM peptidoglycan-binding domain-containing protein [Thermoanaerobacterales bacterium]NLN20508.1 LysM peptidoglycan-binding domain-containing protein [Syntrophomonadaceae bacterium]HAF18026.1 hypothetical protein [Peptococcaceae bacterium]
MNRKTFWLLITVIAVACIVLPAVSSAYNALNSDNKGQAVDKQDIEEKKTEEEKNEEKTEEKNTEAIPGELEEESEQEQNSEQKYTVQDGDNLWLIATRFNTSVEAIMYVNNLSSEILIPGQELLIPEPGTTVPSTAENRSTAPSRSQVNTVNYVVQYGDSLWSIALKFQTSVETIKELNGLTGDQIHPGMTLRVSGKSSSPSRQQSGSNSNPAPQPKKENSTKPKQKENQVNPPQPKANILETAKQFQGVPYKYGGSSPSGFDCSGFVQYVYGLHGIKLPRVAADQAKTGTRVDSPAVGDLVFFAENGSVVHVGIYAGNNTFIHANRKQGVIFTSLNQQWYKERYIGANRY